ncbi:MAG: serine--tRNA ligase [Candidatus Levybacteria bacterium RIFCSPHIGHO2_01_FULL_41_15]|nr:MAG: serine--tRNA ligase [Candidatus Levybacteria bacterium RIFCSPHIGHO2_01_FULL_41_15]
MIDIKLIRENPQEIKKKIKDRGVDIDTDHILKLDTEVKELSTSVQKLREERNKAASEKDIKKGRKIKEELRKQEERLRISERNLEELLLQLPNIVLHKVPVGDASKNEVIKTEGSPPKFSFAPKDHLELGENLGIIDTKRAAKVSGTRFGFLKGDAALLEFALIQFVLEKLLPENFIPIVPPVLLKSDITEGLGYWQLGGNENYYFVRDFELSESKKEKNVDLYLVGTGEHAVVPMHKDEVFNIKDLPKRYLVFSSSFRREAGSYGKDTRGIFRVHQFDKLEMVSFVRPKDDEIERKKLLETAEKLVADLGLPYQLVRLATQDLAFPSAETIDIEIWMPSQNKYRETHSISTTTDFQARRLNIKYQAGNERSFVHILNGTAFAIGRTIIAILENYQQKDGSILVPKVLQKYMGKTSIKPQK